MEMSTVQVFQMQQDIINLQSKVIDDLFLQLMQHASLEEVDNMSCIAKINRAAELRAMIGT